MALALGVGYYQLRDVERGLTVGLSSRLEEAFTRFGLDGRQLAADYRKWREAQRTEVQSRPLRQLVAVMDGSSQGNPGPAGIGAVVHEDGSEVHRISEPIGIATNNEAEARVMVEVLRWAADLDGADRVELTIQTDSELAARHLSGVYRCKQARLRKLRDEARALASRIGSLRVEEVGREATQEAHDLAVGAARLPRA